MLKQAIAQKGEEEKEGVDKEIVFATLIDFHTVSVKNNKDDSEEEEIKMLQDVYAYGKRAISSKPARLGYVKQVEAVLSEEMKESLYFTMTKSKLEEDEAFMAKDKLSNLESLSNELCKDELKAIIADRITQGKDSTVPFSESIYVRAKITIMRHILREGQSDIAIKYLKKVVFGHNRNLKLQAMLLERAAKLLLQSYSTAGISITDFTKKILRDVACDKMTAKTFEHLKTCTMIHNLPNSDTVEIYEAKLVSSAFSSSAVAWIDYHGFLKASGMHLEAKRAIERAMSTVTDKQAILKNCKQ